VQVVNRQLVSVFNFLVTVGGAFAFGYKATEYSLEVPNIPAVSELKKWQFFYLNFALITSICSSMKFGCNCYSTFMTLW
jgi:hypothetical protein